MMFHRYTWSICFWSWSLAWRQHCLFISRGWATCVSSVKLSWSFTNMSLDIIRVPNILFREKLLRKVFCSAHNWHSCSSFMHMQKVNLTSAGTSQKRILWKRVKRRLFKCCLLMSHSTTVDSQHRQHSLVLRTGAQVHFTKLQSYGLSFNSRSYTYTI